jgi:hypothetical protein
MNKDLHPTLGPRQRTRSVEDCLEQVRAHYPCARMEGSTGAERSFWVAGELVGHSWPVARSRNEMWLRVRPVKPASAK